ncbi:hypothetical protein EGW08_007475 [Elysia chlorotica]|uniref:Nuclear receptor domain-containing protein n=1 Tax=Elysia chlorotica TaxID=188477 RepID=A0A3S0ZWL3_ELYCH|nr:hypothetical protein EGW08_007475 [Elysia chlorotica]
MDEEDGRPSFSSQCGGKCDVLKGGRVRCQHCRFQKCISAGMNRKEKPEAVEPAEGQLLCKVCGDIANGIHFGVITCEGCKKFFRRGLKENRSYTCKGSMHCSINPRMRNNCRFCRYQKCLLEGMSREAIKMGRPKKGEVTYSKPSIKKNGLKIPHARNLISTTDKTGVVSSSSMNLMNTASSLSSDFEQDEVSSTDAGNGSVLFDHHHPHQHQDTHQHEQVLHQQHQHQSGGFSSLGSILHDCMTVQDWDSGKLELGQAAPSATSADLLVPTATPPSSSTGLARSIPDGSALVGFSMQDEKQRDRQAFQIHQHFQSQQRQAIPPQQDSSQKHVQLLDHFSESTQSYQSQQPLEFPENDCCPDGVPMNRAVKVEDDRLDDGPEGTFSQNVVLETMQNMTVIQNSVDKNAHEKSPPFLSLQQQSRHHHDLQNQGPYDIQSLKPIPTYLLPNGNVVSGDALNIVEGGDFDDRDIKYSYTKDMSVSDTVDAASSLGASVAAKLGGQVLAINMSGRSVTYVPQTQETIFLPGVDVGNGEVIGENGVQILHRPGDILLSAPQTSFVATSEGGSIDQGQNVYSEADLNHAANAPHTSAVHEPYNGLVKTYLSTPVSSYPPNSFNNLLAVSNHHHQQQQVLQQQQQQHDVSDSRETDVSADESIGPLLRHDLDATQDGRNTFRQQPIYQQHFESPREPNISPSQLTPSLLSQPSIIKHILTNVATSNAASSASSGMQESLSRTTPARKTPISPRSVESLLQQYREAVRLGKPVQLFPDEIAALLSTITSEQSRLLRQQQQQQQKQQLDEVLPPQAQSLTATPTYSPTSVSRPLSQNSSPQSQVQQQQRRHNVTSPHTSLNRSSPFIAHASPNFTPNTPSPRPASRNLQSQHLVVAQRSSPVQDIPLHTPISAAGYSQGGKTISPILEARLQQASSPRCKSASSHSDCSSPSDRASVKSNSQEVIMNHNTYHYKNSNNHSNPSPTGVGLRSPPNSYTLQQQQQQQLQHHRQQLDLSVASATAEVIDDSFNSSLVRDSALLHEINRIFLGIDNSCESCACDRRSAMSGSRDGHGNNWRKKGDGGASTKGGDGINEPRTSERMDATLSSLMSPDEFMPELSHNYWHGFKGSSEQKELTAERQQIIQDIMAAFDNLQRTFVLKDHDQAASPVSRKSNDLLEHWHLIQKRIARHVVAGQRFCRNIPGYFKIDIQDRISLGKHVGFGLMVLIACTEFYDPEFKRFRHIWNWVVQMQNPLFSYKVHLLQLGERVHGLGVDSTEAAMLCAISMTSVDTDSTEAAMLCAISMTSVDCPDLVKPNIVCHVRDILIGSLEAYMAAKQAPPDRLAQLLSIMPQVRLMTVWYNNLMKRMSLPSDIATSSAASRPGGTTTTTSTVSRDGNASNTSVTSVTRSTTPANSSMSSHSGGRVSAEATKDK